MITKNNRCEWVGTDPLMIAYHDKEWGVPIHDDTILFEFLILEGSQAGLSWSTILRKRDNYKSAFDFFDAQKIANYKSNKINSLLSDPGIIRNRLKISATVQNAKAMLKVAREYKSFDKYIWQFVNYTPIKHSFKELHEYPKKTKEAENMSKDLLRRGFKFVGPTICYAFMQAIGMVNDHQKHCFRFKELDKLV